MAITTQLNSGTPTAYAPLVAGTTAAGAIQFASTGLPTSGYVLTSNGASAVPSFQALPAGVNVTSSTLNQSQLQSIYATPIQIVAAGGAHTVIAVNMIVTEYFYTTAVFTGGGAGILQYGSTNHGGGLSIATLSGISLLGNSQSTYYTIFPALSFSSTANVNLAINAGVYISNQTAAWAAGNASSSFKITVYYSVLSTVN